MDEQGYICLLSNVLSNGEARQGRNGKTYSLFGEKLDFNLKTGFPLLTTKKVFIRGVAEELFWFLRGSTDSNELSKKGINIWEKNTTRQFLDSVGLNFLTPGQLGAGYGHCWRSFGGNVQTGNEQNNFVQNTPGVDQIKYILEELISNPHGRRALLSAWNPCQLNLTVLPPCHYSYQFYINSKGLSCMCVCRSQDLCAGTPFNIASTALLTHLIAHLLYIPVNTISLVMGDVHVYDDHVDYAHTQIDRSIFLKPTLTILKEAPPLSSTISEKLKWLETLNFTDILFEYYKFHPAIKYALS